MIGLFSYLSIVGSLIEDIVKIEVVLLDVLGEVYLVPNWVRLSPVSPYFNSLTTRF